MKNLFDLDYNKSILSVSNSLLKYYGVNTFHSSLSILDEKLRLHPKNVILMILDGMGMDLIKKHLSAKSFIRKNILTPILSVFPPTTTAATTAFHSGLSPWESGWIGWTSYYEEYDEIVENFNNIAFYSGKNMSFPAPIDDVLKYETIYEKITAYNPGIEYHKIFPPFDKNGVKSFKEMCDRIIKLSKKSEKEKLFCAYWTEPDHSVHKYGVEDDKIKIIMEDIDANLQKLSNELEDTLLIVSADHGEIDVEEIYLNSYPNLCDMLLRPLSLEARFVTFFVKSDKIKVFASEFNQLLGHDFKLYSKKEFMDSGLLGNGKMHPQIPKFLGDFVAISIGNKNLRYSTGEREFNVLKADHAGISEQEMYVPLILVEKK